MFHAGQIWAKYPNVECAKESLLQLDQSLFHGMHVSVKYELGVDANGRPIVAKGKHNTVIRQVGDVRVGYQATVSDQTGGNNSDTSVEHPKKKEKKMKNCQSNSMSVTYTHKSLLVNSQSYPFPSGMYLTRVISLSRTVPTSDPLLQILTDTRSMGNKYAKECSEAMAMVDAVARAVKLTHACDLGALSAHVYVLGDGKKPFAAAALCLHCPESWHFTSIDPLLEPVDVGATYVHRFNQFTGLSQDYDLSQVKCCSPCSALEKVSLPSLESSAESSSEPTDESAEAIESGFVSVDTVNPATTAIILNSQFSQPPSVPPFVTIVVACHSHAPLKNFWDRVDGHKIAVTMPCCAQYCALTERPVFEFDDFEVYSAKRKIFIYESNLSNLS